MVDSSVNGKIVQEENESSMLDTKCKFICEFIPGYHNIPLKAEEINFPIAVILKIDDNFNDDIF